MRNTILFLLLLALPSETMGTCCCIIAPMHIFGDGSALMFAKRYETGDCVTGRCRYPTNVKDYRLKGNWEHYPELCPGQCRHYGPRSSVKASEADAPCGAQNAPADEPDPPIPPLDKELPVKEDFNPVESETVPRGSEAQLVGFFTLRMANKIATNIDSDSCVNVGQDIEVKIFSVRVPKMEEQQLIAYEVKREGESEKSIDAENITNVRYEPQLGDRILSLQVSLPDNDEFRGKTLYLLRGPKVGER